MKTHEMKCPNCSGIMNYDEANSKMVCPYCDNVVLVEKEKSSQEKAQEAHDISFAKQDAYNKANEQSEKRKRKDSAKRTIILLIIIVGGFIAFISFLINFSQSTKTKIKDPFEFIEIEFNGNDGEGKASIIRKSVSDINLNYITYKLYKTEELKENEEITITAESTEYNLLKTEKKVKVKGLSLYIKKYDELTEDITKEINETTRVTQMSKLNNNTTFYGTVESIEPHLIELLVNDKDTIILDISKVKISKEGYDKTYTKYLLTEYDKASITTDGELTYDVVKVPYHSCPATISGGMNDYAGYISGFETLDEVNVYIKNNYNGYKIIKK